MTDKKKYPFKLIAAVAENGVIGNGAQIPWHISEEFKHFKRTTLGGVVVFGRKTWESIGRALPKRENVVITRNPESVMSGVDAGALPPETSVCAVSSLASLAEKFAEDPRNIWICGGANLYKQALPQVSEIVLSRVKRAPEGDVLFPDFESDFVEVSRESFNPDFDVIRYMRK